MKAPRVIIAAALSLSAVIALSGCQQSDPLNGGGASGSSDTIVVGWQKYYSNEIIGEIYAQALEADGKKVERKPNIGQREAYLPALESGEVTLFPEYSGNLLQYYDKETKARSSEDVYKALEAALPKKLKALDEAPASDGDSYTVTTAFANEHGLKSIEDLSKVSNLTLGGPAELEKRPYGPSGLKSVYGIDVKFSATADTTVDELIAGNVQVANVFTADPRIKTDNLTVLEDPKSLFLASNVVPIVNADQAEEVGKVLNPISAKLTADDLIALNVQSTKDQKSASVIAKEWLTKNGFVK